MTSESELPTKGRGLAMIHLTTEVRMFRFIVSSLKYTCKWQPWAAGLAMRLAVQKVECAQTSLTLSSSSQPKQPRVCQSRHC